MPRYSIIVGNIGTIDHYPTKKAALQDFAEYKRQSKAGYGNAAFESVVLFDNNLGEPIKEYIGSIDNNEE
jgi:hypothetical protein